jgi:hypothetical protein
MLLALQLKKRRLLLLLTPALVVLDAGQERGIASFWKQRGEGLESIEASLVTALVSHFPIEFFKPLLSGTTFANYHVLGVSTPHNTLLCFCCC